MPSLNSSPDDANATVPQSMGRRLAEILLIMLVFFAFTGDPPPNVNEAHYLCRLKHFWNPQFGAGDLFLESQDTQVAFIWLFGWVTRFVSLTATAWIGRIVVWALLAWSWQKLSWRLVPQVFASVLSAALFVTLNKELHFAGEWIVGGVEAKSFAYAFVLLALTEVLNQRWNRAWILLGAATAFHPLVGGWSGVICAGIWWIVDRKAVPLWSMIVGLVAGAVISLPGIVPALALTWSEPAEVIAEANRIYVFERLPHHLAPLTLPRKELMRRGLGFGMLTVLMAFLAWGASRQEKQGSGVRTIGLFAAGSLVISAIGLLIETVFWNDPATGAKLLRYYWFRLADFAVPMAVAFYAIAIMTEGLRARRAWAAWFLLATMAVAGWNVGKSTTDRWLAPLPPADRKIKDFQAWVDVCQWANENTPAHALFLTPRLNLTFKWRAGRPEVVNRKDLPQDARSIVEWHRRIRDTYYARIEGKLQPLDSLGILGTDRVRELAIKNHADYVLMDRGQLLSLPVAYWNEEYVVYRIDRGNPATSGQQ